jgi:hypothetical protein
MAKKIVTEDENTAIIKSPSDKFAYITSAITKVLT